VVRIELSQEEIGLLHNYAKTSPIGLMREKAHAVLLRSRGILIKDIAFSLNAGYRTIERWIKDFSGRRMASIFSGLSTNENASKLTREQKAEIKKILSEAPSEVGLPREFWDVPQLKQYVETTFGVVYESVQSYHFLLRFSNLSFKYPATFDSHRDEEAIEKRVVEIRQEIQPYLESNEWEVFASDETRMILEAITRRAWLKRGEKTVLKVERKRESQSYLGMLNQKTFVCHVYELDWQNQEEILKAMELFLKEYPNKRICIVWDNARFHKGKLIREALGKGGLLERVHLINLPPYAPDHNPIEKVWGTVKGKIANHQYEAFEKTKEAFRHLVSSQIFHYQI